MADPRLPGPVFVRYFGPVLDALDELGGTARPTEVYRAVAKNLGISEEQQAETLSSGQPRFDNQVGWAKFYLVKDGLIDNSTKGIWTITESGRMARPMDHSTAHALFAAVHARFKPQAPVSDVEGESVAPVTSDAASDILVSNGADYRLELLSLLKSISPANFERFCQRLLRELGFEDVVVTGRSGDGGIDGVGRLQVNPLLSIRSVFQCKRYASSVTSPDIRNFRGAMAGRSDYGIILTTSSFTADARNEAIRDGVPPVELVDGDRLVTLCEERQLGLVPRMTYDVDRRLFEQLG